MLLLFFVPLQRSFAITSTPVLFDLSKIVLQQEIPANTKEVQLLKLFPFTTIAVNPGTFDQDVMVFVYKGDFDKIKAALPPGQSPISSYYLIFRSTRGIFATPLLPLNVQSYNNYSNTDSFYYPVDSSQKIDEANKKNWSGNILVNINLPITDTGFIVATNKNLDKKDQALNVGVKTSAPSVTPASNTLAGNSFVKQNIYLILTLVIIVISILAITFLLLKGSKKTNI